MDQKSDIRLGVSFEEWEKSHLERAKDFPSCKFVNPKSMHGFAGYMTTPMHSNDEGLVVIAHRFQMDEGVDFKDINRGNLFLYSAYETEDGIKNIIVCESPLWFNPNQESHPK